MCLVNLEVLLPLKPLLSQRSELVQQLRPVLTPAPLVDQHQEGVRPHRPVLTNPPLAQPGLSHLQQRLVPPALGRVLSAHSADCGQHGTRRGTAAETRQR